MLTISRTPDRLDIVSPMPWGTRVLLALLAAIPLLAPFELLVGVPWTSYLNPFFLFAAVVSAGAVAVSGLLLFAAAAGISSRMTLDAARGTFTYSAAAPLVPRRERTFPLASAGRVAVRSRDWSDGAPTYSLEIALDDGPSFASGSSPSREEVERACDRARAFLDRAHGGRSGAVR